MTVSTSEISSASNTSGSKSRLLSVEAEVLEFLSARGGGGLGGATSTINQIKEKGHHQGYGI